MTLESHENPQSEGAKCKDKLMGSNTVEERFIDRSEVTKECGLNHCVSADEEERKIQPLSPTERSLDSIYAKAKSSKMLASRRV